MSHSERNCQGWENTFHLSLDTLEILCQNSSNTGIFSFSSILTFLIFLSVRVLPPFLLSFFFFFVSLVTFRFILPCPFLTFSHNLDLTLFYLPSYPSPIKCILVNSLPEMSILVCESFCSTLLLERFLYITRSYVPPLGYLLFPSCYRRDVLLSSNRIHLAIPDLYLSLYM